MWPAIRLFLITRGGLYYMMYAAQLLWPGAEGHFHLHEGRPLIAGWVRWDGEWYAGIAESGYSLASPPDRPGQINVAFFPAFPLAVWLLAPIFGSVEIAGVVL